MNHNNTKNQDYFNKSTKSTAMNSIQTLSHDVSLNGASLMTTLEFRYDDIKGFGIFTTIDLQPDSILIKLPYSLCLSVDMISCDFHLSKILKENPGLRDYPDEILALGIMYAQNPSNECEWSCHVQTFPKSLNSTMFWSDYELEELKCCNVFHITKMLQRQIKTDWENFHYPLTKDYPDLFQHHTLELYQHALAMVYSRAIGIRRKNQYIRCIPPLIDMANHSIDAGIDASDAFYYDEKSNEIIFYNRIALKANDECCASYGNYSNSKLAHTYGFVIPHNPVRKVDLWTRVSTTTAFGERKQNLLNKYPLTSIQTYDFEGTIRNEYISPALLMTIRIIQCNEAELDILESRLLSVDNPEQCLKMVSTRNELASYVSLKNLVIQKMTPDLAEVTSVYCSDCQILIDYTRITLVGSS